MTVVDVDFCQKYLDAIYESTFYLSLKREGGARGPGYFNVFFVLYLIFY